MKEGSTNDNIISKLPEFTNQDKNSRRKDYNNVKDALHYTDYEDNKYGSQNRPPEGTPDTCQCYEDNPSHMLSTLTPDLLNPSRNSSPTLKGSQSDSDESVCPSRGGMFETSSPDTKSSLSELIGTDCLAAEWKEELEEEWVEEEVPPCPWKDEDEQGKGVAMGQGGWSGKIPEREPLEGMLIPQHAQG
jgi:hypothetical protein